MPTDNPYGKRFAEVAAVLRHLNEIEPRLWRVARHLIDARAPVAAVVGTMLRLVGGPPKVTPRG